MKMPQTKEERKANAKEWRASEAGRKSGTISRWKKTGKDIGNDWDKIYNTYKCTNFCVNCNTPLTEGNEGNERNKGNQKCLSRNVDTGEICGIICRDCHNNYYRGIRGQYGIPPVKL